MNKNISIWSQVDQGIYHTMTSWRRLLVNKFDGDSFAANVFPNAIIETYKRKLIKLTSFNFLGLIFWQNDFYWIN